MPIIADNLAHWNEVTPHHVVSPMYRTDDFRRGEIVLDPVVRDAIGDVRGQRLDEGDLDYTGAVVAANRTQGHLHGLARILTAATDAGLAIRGFAEGDRAPWKVLDRLVKLDRDYWGLPPDAPRVPLSFTLQAVKEA